MENIGTILLAIVVVVVVIVVAWLILWKLYRRSTTELAFVRTGFLGRKVVINGGAFVIPVLHELTRVNMGTQRLGVVREKEDSIQTKDRMRADVSAAFYVRVKPEREMVGLAAQTLGSRTGSPDAMAELLEAKLVAALRSQAALLTLEELYEGRGAYIAAVGKNVAEALAGNGLELESASIIRLEQTGREFFVPTNAFDADGLTRLTRDIEERRRARNEIEQDNLVAIEQKNLDTERRRLDIQREEEFARLELQREVALRRADQQAEVAAHEEGRRRDSEDAAIQAQRALDQARQQSDQMIAAEKIALDRRTRETEIASTRELEIADIERRREVELAEQVREAEISRQSMERSKAQAEAEAARAKAVRAEEQVISAREIERAERQGQIDLISAMAAVDREGKARVADAEASEAASRHQAETTRLIAEADAAAEKLKAEAYEIRAGIEATAERERNEADNALSDEARNLRLRLALVERMEAIIRESVRPLERIDGVKILNVAGLGGTAQAGEPSGSSREGWADQLVDSVLRHRGQAPLVDHLLQELGIGDAAPTGLSEALTRLSEKQPESS